MQNQMKQKRLDEASAAVHAAPSNEGRDAEGTISQVESKSDLSTNSHSIVESKTNNS